MSQFRKNTEMRRLPRHLIIGFIAAWLPILFLLSGQAMIKALHGIELQAMMVSFLLWFIFSLLIRRNKIAPWLIVEFISPFIGLPVVFYFLSETGLQNAVVGSGTTSVTNFVGSTVSKLVFGFISAAFLSWIFVSVGMLMGLAGFGVSRLFARYEKKNSGAVS
jgi:hypothetical protein